MGFWPQYQPGDPPPNSARRESEISNMLNRMGAVSALVPKGAIPPTFRIQVYNPSDTEIPVGAVIAVDEAEKENDSGANQAVLPTMIGPAIPVRPFVAESDSDKRICYLEVPIGPQEIGSAVIFGLVWAKLTGDKSQAYCKPVDGYTFERADAGLPVIAEMYPQGDDGQPEAETIALILIGGVAAGGGVPLVIMTVRPNGGYGPGFQATPTLDGNGKVVSLGANVAAMIPYQGQGA